MIQTRELLPTTNSGHSTRGGFQSDAKLLDLPDPAIELLKKGIYSSVAEYLPTYYAAQTGLKYANQEFLFDLWGWLTMFTEGGYNAPHIHPRSTISGVYYVQTPEQIIKNADRSFAGWLGFMDPRQNAQIWPLPGQVNHSFVPPEAGCIILFPSYLTHFVPPYTGGGQRISIAFNLRHKIDINLEV